MAKSPRAEQLDKLRDLIVLAKKKNVTLQKELELLAIREGIFTKENGKAWKHSRIFQYIDGLHWLGFNLAQKRSGQIVLTKSANKLAIIGKKNYQTNQLSNQEKRIFYDRIFTNEYIQNNFIKYFSPNQKPIWKFSNFIKVALPIYVTKVYQKKIIDETSDRIRSQRLCDILTEHGVEYKVIDSTEFLYTVRYWFLDLEVVDDLHISPRYGIKLNHMIFPIKLRLDDFANISKFEEIIKKVCQPDERSIPIPVLIYRICKRFFISVEQVKMLIEAVFHEKPDRYYLNRAPEFFLDIRYKKSYMHTSNGFWRDEIYLKGDRLE